MCWSAEVSLRTYLFGMLTLLYHLKKAAPMYKISKTTLVFLAVFTHVQLAEWGIWNNLKSINWNKFAAFVLLLEPVSSALLLLPSHPLAAVLHLGVYIAGSVALLYSVDTLPWSSSKGKQCHLKWDWYCKLPWSFRAFWLTCFFAPMLIGVCKYNQHPGLLLISVATFIVTRYYTRKSPEEFSSNWCIAGNVGWTHVMLQTLRSP
jgi:hypothetical protein